MTLTHHLKTKPSDAYRTAIHVRRAERIAAQQRIVDELDDRLLVSLRRHDGAKRPGEDQALCDAVIYDTAMLEVEKTVLSELLLRWNRDGSRIIYDVDHP